MNLKLYKGRKVIHKTLGKVIIVSMRRRWFDDTVLISLLPDPNRPSAVIDDDGGTIYIGETWNYGYKLSVHKKNLISMQDHRKGPIISRINRLWRESNYVKTHELKY